jgi:anti-sigma factor RsiW
VAEIIGSDAHVDPETLGLHYMDALDPAESDTIHRHLEECPACQARAEEVIDTVAALALLGTDEVVDETPAPVQAPAPAPRSSGPVRPAGRSDSTRPGTKSRRSGRTGKLLQAGSLLALVLVVAGLGLATLLRSPQGEPTPVVTAAAVATDDTTGASASVVVSGEGSDSVTIRATVSGLREGTAYVLYAVTSDSATGEVTSWTGTTAVQEVSGQLPVRIGDLSFFTVSEAGGGPVVSVYLPGVPVAPTR